VTDVIVATAQADVRITFLRPGLFQTPVGIVTPKQRTPGSVAQLFVKRNGEAALEGQNVGAKSRGPPMKKRHQGIDVFV
jgi:hypothetical protein